MIIFGIFGAGNWDSHQYHDPITKSYTRVHDSGATLIVDGKIVCNILEERLTRFKGEGNFPYKSIQYCLEKGNIKAEDVDVVIMPDLACFFYDKQKEDGTIERMVKNIFPNCTFQTVSHHVCHAMSSIYTSPFNEGCFFTSDGTGSRINDPFTGISIISENSTIGYFNKSKREFRLFYNLAGTNTFGPFHFHKSLNLYESIIGKKLTHPDETVSGKIMGLCAYGDYKNIKEWKEYQLVEDFGIPFITFNAISNAEKIHLSNEDRASCIQKNFESAMMDLLHSLKKKSYLEENICFAGGSFLNVITNTKIKESGLFKNIHIPPFPSDTGVSIGAAFYGSFLYDKENEIEIPTNLSLLSKKYSNETIEESLSKLNLEFKKYDNFEELCEFTAQELNKNKIIGWFQNSSESGPRALGSRSLLANPTPAENKDIMNSRVKHREYWRPFAGIILEEHLNEYFEEDFCSPYMLYSFKVREEKKEKIAAITHADNTCRIQTVTKDQHHEIHSLLKKVYKVSGIPVVLNTSFNDNGEPIVETPEDAIRAFINLDIDYLVIGNYIVKSSKNKMKPTVGNFKGEMMYG